MKRHLKKIILLLGVFLALASGAIVQFLTNWGIARREAADLSPKSLIGFISLIYSLAILSIACFAIYLLVRLLRIGRVERWTSEILEFEPGRAVWAWPIIFLSAALGTYFISATTWINRNSMADGDEVAYLNGAISLRNLGGIAGFPGACLSGRYQHSNRHPLYMLFLSTFAKRSLSFFAQAKIFSLFAGAAAVVITFFVIARSFGPLTAMLTTFLLVLNPAFLNYSSSVACETLLICFFVPWWYFTVRGFKDGKAWVAAGAFAGLAYLTKGTGLFLPICFIFSGLVVRRLKICKDKFFWLFFLAFVIVSSPLLTRNLVLYKNPIYNKALHSVYLWSDSVAERYSSVPGRHSPTIITYLTSHPPWDILQRVARGMGAESRVFLYTIGPTESEPYYIPLSLLFFLLFLVAYIKDSSRNRKITTGTTIIFFFLFFSWYLTRASRFILPLVPIMYAYIAVSASGLFRWFLEKKVKKVWALGVFQSFSVLLILLSASIVVPKVRGPDFSNPLKPAEVSQDYLVLASWMKDNINGNLYFKGPDDDWQVEWLSATSGFERHIPFCSSLAELKEIMNEEGIVYIFITKEIYRTQSFVFAPHFIYNEIEGLEPLSEGPEGWKLVFQDPTPPVDYLAYKAE